MDLISRQDAIDACFNGKVANNYDCAEAIGKLPSAEKTGKWMWVQYDANPEIGNWHCSECKFMPSAFNLVRKHLNYCPNCGSEMVGEEE